MKNTTKRKTTLGGLAALAAAGLVLSGCSMVASEAENQDAAPEQAEPTQLEIDGEYAYAPAAEADEDDEGTEEPADEDLPRGDSWPTEDKGEESPEVGDLYTLTVNGTDVQVTRQACTATADGYAPVTDARETAFGQIGETAEDGTAAITWIDGGAYTTEPELPIDVISDGSIVRVGDGNFFASSGDQGTALNEQFSSGCGTDPDEGDPESVEADGDDASDEEEAPQPSDGGGDE